MHPPPPAPPPRARVLRIAGRLALAVIAAFLLDLVILGASTDLQEKVYDTAYDTPNLEKAEPLFLWCLAAAALVNLGAVAGVFRVSRRWSGRILLGAGAGAAAVLAYLAADFGPEHPGPTIDEFTPAFPGAEASFRLLMRYSKESAAMRDFVEPKSPAVIPSIEKRDDWRRFILEHRAQIEAGWAELQPARAWWAELDACDRLGDLTPAELDADIPGFRVFRSVSIYGCLHAGRLALDGHGDEAVDTLAPLLRVGHKLQADSRTLVRSMIGLVVERMAIRTAVFTLEAGPVSPAARARLAAALAGDGFGVEGARRLALVDPVASATFIPRFTLADVGLFEHLPPSLRFALRGLTPFVCNRRATARLLWQHALEVADAFARRQPDQIKIRSEQFLAGPARPPFKNLVGALFVRASVPSLERVCTSYWGTQDDRAALKARLAAP